MYYSLLLSLSVLSYVRCTQFYDGFSPSNEAYHPYDTRFHSLKSFGNYFSAFLPYNNDDGFHQPSFPRQTPNFPQQPPIPTTTPDPSSLTCGLPPASCPNTKYRSFDGSCNNLVNPIWGTPNTRYNRLLPANYADGIMQPPVAKSGRPLPMSRVLSLILYPDQPVEDPKWTLNAMQYGQIITHDMSMIAGSTQAQPHDTNCCSDDGQLLSLGNSPDHCFPIILPKDDPSHRQTNTECMSFVRTITDRDRNCVSGFQPAEQLTQVNHFLDLSIVYGNNDRVNAQLREYNGGRLIVARRNGQDWLPQNNNASGVCDLQSQNEPCYLAGDARVNQNTQLTVLQIILHREHNRIADTLAKLNPHWNDERIFQEARRINIAEHQHITYYEWLPIFIGLENSIKNKILYNTHDFVNDYSDSVDPTIINEHATAAFRFFHSLIAGRLDLVTEHRQSYGSLRMSDWFNRPGIIEEGDNYNDLTRGLATQPELKSDRFHDSEITQYLFRMRRQFGSDLKAFDIQRNRDHGLAPYNDFRVYCGLPRAHSFEDLLDLMKRENVEKLATLYEDVDDIDLTVGGSLENLVPGTLAGPTFLCILTEQFYRTRVGDRFFYENYENGFTAQQLNEIRKVSIARLMCDNSDIKSIQPRAFERISQSNDVLPCESIPKVNLCLWKEDVGGNDHGFTSNAAFNGDYFFKK